MTVILEPLHAALDRAGIEHRDLDGSTLSEARTEILRRLRAAGFEGEIDDLTTIERVAEMIDEWSAARPADDEACEFAYLEDHDAATCSHCKPAEPDEIAHHEAVQAAYAAGDWEKFGELVKARVAKTTNTEK